MTKKLCIYHKHCIDGFGAAWVVHHKYGQDVEFHAAQYGDAPPDVKGRDVIIVDFSYPLEEMNEIWLAAASLVLLDHHLSTHYHLSDWIATMLPEVKDNLIIDMTRSGALMAWDYFFPETTCPSVIQHISDRDLWKLEKDVTKDIHAALSSYDMDFELWDRLILDCPLKSLEMEGLTLRRKFDKDVAALIESTQMDICIGGHVVPAAGIPFLFASEAGHITWARASPSLPRSPFSLRSDKDTGMDVSEIAKQYGGEGHKNAAGFKVDWTTFQGFIIK